MIYILKINDLIFITDQKRDIESKEFQESPSNLLYVLPWDFDLDIFRPWKCLELGDGWYKNDITEFIDEFKDSPQPPDLEDKVTVYKNDITREFNKYSDALKFITALKEIKCPSVSYVECNNIKYLCDIYNYLEDVFTPELVRLCDKYFSLSKTKQDLLYSLSKVITRDGKLEFARKHGMADLHEFLPSWINTSLKVLGKSESYTPKENYSEFQNLNRLDGKLGNDYIKDEIYSIFNLGETLGSQEIKDNLREIYTKLGIEKNPRVYDLTEYFEISRTFNGLYRIVSRKVL